MPLHLYFEHENFVVMYKPSGMNFHTEKEPGVVVEAALLLQRKELFPVHRLDKMTSGLLLLAKNSATAQALGALFEQRQIEKYYLAISARKPKKKQGWIKADMGKARRGSYKLLATQDNPAVTRFISVALREHERLFLIKPYTGKTHQIRVALKSLGSPVCGDTRYANAQEAGLETRGYLHALALRFTLYGQTHTFIAAPQEGARFLTPQAAHAIEQWQKPWELF